MRTSFQPARLGEKVKNTILASSVFGLCLVLNGQAEAGKPFKLELSPLGTYATGTFDKSSAEIVAHDPESQRLFVANAESGQVDVLDIKDPSKPALLFNIDLSGFGAVVNSVAVHKGLVAAAVEAEIKTDLGKAVFLDTDGNVLASVQVGALPDAITFTPDGKRVLVANEGEPNDDYTIDPEGSVSIIDLPMQIAKLTQSHVRTAGFESFKESDLDASVRIFGPDVNPGDGKRVARNMEPEWITVSKDSKTAWVALQENNAIGTLDIKTGKFTAVKGLGFKDHMLPGNELDVSDRDNKINITNWPIWGIYMPDMIANYEYRGKSFIVTANEGDARDWEGNPGYVEASRFRALSGEIPVCAGSQRFLDFFANNEMGISDLSQLRDNANLGRLNVTTATGLRADGSCYEDIYAFGARSFSIYAADSMKQVYDSGSDFERITAKVYPENFNSNHRANSFETRSDDKGPEPEGVVVAKLWGSTYAFIGLERIGGVMVYDISNPYRPTFVQYMNNRDFGFEPGTPEAGDLGAEGLIAIEASKSPIPGVPLLVVANEVSGTTTVFRINRGQLAVSNAN